MKFTLSWLKEHLETDANVHQITEALTDLGLEVEDISDLGDALTDFTIGYIKAAEKHPDADRLQVCQVSTDEGERQIICGAPNARAGIYVVVARPGMYIPGIDTTISTGKIRGVESQGMMCSEREMMLSDEHDGIIEMAEGQIGARFVDVLRKTAPEKIDPVIDIAITPNRPDALGVSGIARDLAARGLGKFISQPAEKIAGEYPCPIGVAIDKDAQEDCPVFFGRVIRGVKNGPSPAWLQARLNAIGLRPISALVDITNFFTIDRNRPLHVFDADKIAGNLRVGHAVGGETLTALDDKEYQLSAGMTVIFDDDGPESLGGIMGGQQSGCTSETVNVFLEAAYFNPVTTALTGRKLKINSDARYRFERGIDPLSAEREIEAATKMILELCGGSPSEITKAGALPDFTRSYTLDVGRVKKLVGMDIPEAEQRRILTDLGFKVTQNTVIVPSWRPDVQGEADLVEEIVRVTSLTKLPALPLPEVKSGIRKPILTQSQRREQMARRTLASLGYNECVTYSFTDQSSAALFGGGGDETALENPISSDLSHMRPSLLPNLLQAIGRNRARGFSDLAFFEVGPVFDTGEPGGERQMIAGVLAGNRTRRNLHSPSRSVDLFDAKADLEMVLHALGAPAKLQITRDGDPWWHPGQHGVFCLGPKKRIGSFGVFHPRILKQIGLKGSVVGFSLAPDQIPTPRAKSPIRSALALNDLQAVDYDFSFVVDARLEASVLRDAVAGADKVHIKSVHIFDEFTGAKAESQFGPGKKSLALSVRIEPVDKTLTQDEIDAISEKIIQKAIKATNGVLRQ